MINVLSFDDDLDFHQILKAKLPASEFKLTSTLKENEFFDQFGSKKYDVCLLDLSIGDNALKGFEILNKIRNEIKSNIPVVVISSLNSKKVISSALEIGANDFLSKPIDDELFNIKINAVVAGKQSYGRKIEPIESFSHITLSSRLKLIAISEKGFIVSGNAYIAKGAKIRIQSNRIKEIFGVDSITAYSTGFQSRENGIFVTNLEIDPEQKDLSNSARLWIKANQK